MELLESKRGGRTVHYNSFKYNFGSNNKKNDSTRWLCVTRTCNVKLFTNKKNLFTSAAGEHNHDAYDKWNIDCIIVNTACKRKSLEIYTRLKKFFFYFAFVNKTFQYKKKIILKEIIQSNASLNLNVVDVKRLRNNMNKARVKGFLLNSTNINEVLKYIDTVKTKAVTGESFLLK